MGVTLAKDNHSVSNGTPGVYTLMESNGSTNFTEIRVKNWHYLAFSFNLIDMTDTEVEFFKYDKSLGKSSFSETFIIDRVGYKGLLGIEQTSETEFANHM
jgi:hypothetical protein